MPYNRATAITSTFLRHGIRKFSSVVPSFASVDPYKISGATPGVLKNLAGGEWIDTSQTRRVIDPLNGEPFLLSPDTVEAELEPFRQSLNKVPNSGRHNIYKNPERFLMYGDVFCKVSETMRDPAVHNFFVKCIQRVMPKSEQQASGEVVVVRKFFENFSGDGIRQLMRGFVQSGDYAGQRSVGYRWPYGRVAVISPFNFPLEIPIMQFCAAAMVGNKPIVKPESHVGLTSEQFIRLLHHCGLPKNEIDLIHCSGSVMDSLLTSVDFRMTQFTGGSPTAKSVIQTLKGRVKLEDSGFDWKVLGPMDTSLAPEQKQKLLDYVAWQCDQDAYALSGQKCSAQSVALIHDDWIEAGLLDKIKVLASRRNLKDMTLSPLLSHTNEDVFKHINKILSIPGSKILFGNKPLTGHTIPSEFGAFEPTAVMIDLHEVLKSPDYYKSATEELFGPFQIIARWSTKDEPLVIEFLKNMEALLTAAVVSHDPLFINRILSDTSNGTTYCGIRARTTGAPQNHWFGPSGSPLAAGIGSPEAVLSTWTAHREIVYDEGPIPDQWTLPAAT